MEEMKNMGFSEIRREHMHLRRARGWGEPIIIMHCMKLSKNNKREEKETGLLHPSPIPSSSCLSFASKIAETRCWSLLPQWSPGKDTGGSPGV